MRAVRITASEAKSVSTFSSDAARQTYLEKKLWSNNLFSCPQIEYGKVNENIAREAYQLQTSNHVQTTGLWANNDFPSLACSPDGIVFDTTADMNGLLEIKCPYILKDTYIKSLTPEQKKHFCLEICGDQLKLKRNHQYYYQIQTQIGIMKLKWCDFAVWSPKELYIERIVFDEIFCFS